jgi:putative solute:sodium symporter small subunit
VSPEARSAGSKNSSVTVGSFFNKKEMTMQLTARHQEYWGKNLRITGLLLALWFFVTFVLLYFSRDLTFSFFGWPFSFWVAAQGALIVYCLIIWYYARYMNNLDKEYGVSEGEEA